MKLRLQMMCAALVISLRCLYPQENLPGNITSLLEDITAISGENEQAPELAEEISLLADNPVKINSRDEEEIKRLFFLTLFQVRSIIDYTKRNGDILSAKELSYIPGFDNELAVLAGTFMTFEKYIKNSNRKRGSRFKLITNILTDTEKDDYIGGNYKLLSRMHLYSGPIDAYLTIDKDKGEPFLMYGYKPDFLSGSMAFSNDGILSRFIIGDFKVRFGQGLTAWNGFSRSPLPTAKILMKGNSGIIPCSSSDENDFFRGIAVSLRTRNINILSFASINMIDASTGYDESSDNQYIKSFYTSGIHNTPTTMAKRNRLAENSLGLNINSMNNNFYYGFNIVYSRFSLPVIPGEDTRDIYDFTGDINASFSVDYTWLFKSSYLFGEFAVSHNLKTAFLQGISLNPEGRLRCNILYARTGRGYNSFHGDASGLSTFNKPATSLQANITAELFSSLDFTAGFLRRKELWHNNTSGSFPSSINYLTSVRFSPSEFITVRTDAKHHVSELWVNALQGVKTGNLLRKTNLRLTIETQASESLNLRTRIEKVVITNSSESGFLCYQSAGFIFKNIPLELRARVAIFKTDSYDTRIYAWEDDLLYNPVIRPLYDEGNKSYLMIIYRASGNITLRAKYASTSINAGKDISNMVNEYKFQAVISF